MTTPAPNPDKAAEARSTDRLAASLFAEVLIADQLSRNLIGKALPKGWGEVLTEQLPESALAPLTIALGRESIKLGGKLSAGAVGKAIPFGVGAVIGGVGNRILGKQVVEAAREAFGPAPLSFHAELAPRGARQPKTVADRFQSARRTERRGLGGFPLRSRHDDGEPSSEDPPRHD